MLGLAIWLFLIVVAFIINGFFGFIILVLFLISLFMD
jgi:hypothetical protein